MFRYLFVFSVLIFSLLTNAVEVKDLYVATIPVSSQKNSDRAIALKKAMKVVLVKIGGESSVLEAPSIKLALKNYKNFYATYRYQKQKNQKQKNQNNLIVSFDENKINQLFIDANLPLWGSLRPQILMWIVEEDGLSREVLSATAMSNIPTVVTDFSSRNGLPILLPLMDLTDASQLQMSDLWGRFITPIEQVSARYFPEMVVVLRLSNSSLIEQVNSDDLSAETLNETANETLGQINKPISCEPLCKKQQIQVPLALDWQLISDDEIIISKSQGLVYQSSDTENNETQGNASEGAYANNSYEKLLLQALNDIKQVVYQKYALTAQSDSEYVIDVNNVDSLATYEALSQFLNELSSVSAVKLQRAQGHNRRFSLELIGSKAAFLASIKLNKSLKQFIDPLAEVNRDDIPVFIWGSK